jgi:hypothetical protein
MLPRTQPPKARAAIVQRLRRGALAFGVAISLTAAPAPGVTGASAVPIDACDSQLVVPPAVAGGPAGTSGAVTANVYSELQGRTVHLEVSGAAGWTPVSSVEVAPSMVMGQLTPSQLPYPAELAQSSSAFRVRLEAVGVCVELASEPFAISFSRARYTFTEVTSMMLPRNGASLSTRSGVTLTATAQLENPDGGVHIPEFVLQRSVAGGEWTIVGKAAPDVTPDSEDAGRFYVGSYVPRLSASTKKKGVTIAYRFATVESDTVEAGASSAYTVEYFNARSVIKKAIRRSCPSTKIVFKSTFKNMPSDWVGYYDWGKNTIGILNSYIDEEASIEQVRTLGYHECGHRLQQVTYGNHAAATKAAARYFGDHEQPLEHWADCVANFREPTVDPAYGGTCNAKELRYAKKTLRKKRI